MANPIKIFSSNFNPDEKSSYNRVPIFNDDVTSVVYNDIEPIGNNSARLFHNGLPQPIEPAVASKMPQITFSSKMPKNLTEGIFYSLLFSILGGFFR